MDSPFLETLAAGFVGAGFLVVRFEFPYMAGRREGLRRPPDRAVVLRQTWHDVVAALDASVPRSRVAIGGKSMGGRIASLVADDLDVGALVCFGYPFQPPKARSPAAGTAANPRVAHLAGLRTPTLIVQGERDPFGGRAEVAGYALSPAIELAWCPDGDHSLRPRRASGHTEASNLALAVARVVAFLASRRV